MALVLKDRVRETSIVTGTGTATLNGAVNGYQSFSVIGDGNTTYYTISRVGSTEWEVGIGTYTASGPTLSRDTVLESSNAGALVNFSSGTKDVFVTYPAEKSVYVDGTTLTPASTAVLPITSGGTGSNTATFSGANITSLNASSISSGTLDNARTTASSANGASTIVARDASGNFAAAAITGTSFSGSGASLTSLNADAITSGTVANARTTASSANGASTIVARDASGNFSANTITASLSGTATTGTNWGAYGAVPAAGTSFGNANTIGRSDANGYAYFNYINSNTGNSENPSVSQVIVTNGGDNFYRKSSIAHLTGSLSGTAPISITGNSNNISAYTINQNLGTANGPTFTEVYNNGWFRNNNTATGLYNQTTGRGIWSAENYNSYGSYTTYGSGLNGWIGWGIQGSFHFMGRTNTDCGLYDSSNGKWLIYGLYNSNGVGLNTSTTSASYGAYVNGGLYATGNVVAYSDQRKKENIITVNDPVNILMNLRGVYYNRIDDNDKKRQIGVIAQEVEKVLPEVVNYAPDVDEYGVSYGNFAGLFIEVLKTQQKEIALLKQEIEQLKR